MTATGYLPILDEIHAAHHAGVLDEATALQRMTQACEGLQITPVGVYALLLDPQRPSVSLDGGRSR